MGGNGGELAIMFCFAFLLIATTGAGTSSVDARPTRRVRPTAHRPGVSSLVELPAARTACSSRVPPRCMRPLAALTVEREVLAEPLHAVDLLGQRRLGAA